MGGAAWSREARFVAIDHAELFVGQWGGVVARALRRLGGTPTFIFYDPDDPPRIPVCDPSVPENLAELE